MFFFFSFFFCQAVVFVIVGSCVVDIGKSVMGELSRVPPEYSDIF